VGQRGLVSGDSPEDRHTVITRDRRCLVDHLDTAVPSLRSPGPQSPGGDGGGPIIGRKAKRGPPVKPTLQLHCPWHGFGGGEPFRIAVDLVKLEGDAGELGAYGHRHRRSPVVA